MNITSAITVVRTTERGALLITDGVHIAWVMGRTRRADGTFTPSALTALAEGKTVAEHEAERAAYLARKEAEFQEGKLPTSITVGIGRVTDYSPNAWKVRTDSRQCLYGRWCWKYEYLPKSMVSVEFKEHATVLTMPRWFLAKHQWIERL